ncbi:MAG: protein-glutamate O-methyltransferase CheR [Acidobacteriota bacterium]
MQSSVSMGLEELALFNELFSSKFGLHFPEHKREILESRLLPRLRANHLQRFSDYYLLLQYDFQQELDPLTRAITNNESYFFRETSQFDSLKGDVIKELIQGGRTGSLNVLSAGCSSGEEPYTLNIYLRALYPVADPRTLRIDGVDLDSERLAQAASARYRPGSLRALDDEQTRRYFDSVGEDSYELRTAYREGVHFRGGNILEPVTLRRGLPYDAVFCRNVLIYFSEPALKTAIDHFSQIVRPGGLLYLGHSESIIGLSDAFQAERLGQCIAYRRKVT